MDLSSLIDWQLIPSAAAAVLAIMQFLKVRKPFDQIDGEVLSAAVGVAVVAYWGVIDKSLATDHFDFVPLTRVVLTGAVAGLSASGVFNLQDWLPITKILKSRTAKGAPQK